MVDHIVKLLKTQEFHSRWLNKDGIVEVEIKKPGLRITVDFEDGERYEEIIDDLPWSVGTMIYDRATTAADIVIFNSRCLVADGEVWLISGNLSGIISVTCKTAKHFCDGKQFVISEKRTDAEIKALISKAIENEVPF